MSVLTLQQAKDYLDITANTYDTELQAFIDSAEAAIAKKVGPLTSVTTTKQVDGRGRALVLPCTPVVSLTSVTGNTGEVVSPADLTVLPPGIVRYTAGGACFPAEWYTVVYQSGRASVPADLLLAVKRLLKRMWSSQRGSGARPGSSPEAAGPAFAMPNEVLELLAPYMQPGFA